MGARENHAVRRLLFLFAVCLLGIRHPLAECVIEPAPVIPMIVNGKEVNRSVDASKSTIVSLSILEIGKPTNLVEAESVSLASASTRFMLQKDKGKYVGKVPEGWYLLEAKVKDRIVQRRLIEIRGETRKLAIYASHPGVKDYFRAGDSLVPFIPIGTHQSIVFEYNIPGRDDVSTYLKSADLKFLKLSYPAATASIPVSWPLPASGNVYLTSTNDPTISWIDIVSALRNGLKKQFPNADVRVGVPVDVGHSGFHALDRRFFIRFAPGVTHDDAIDWLNSQKARRLAKFENNILWVEFASDDYRHNLCEIEKAFAGGLLEIGEPDLVFKLTRQVTLPSTWPNDPEYSNSQLNSGTGAPATSAPHATQLVRKAWELLFAWKTQNTVPRFRRGGDRDGKKETLVLGILDDGFNLEIPELNCGTVLRLVDTGNITARCDRPRCSAGAVAPNCAPDSCFAPDGSHGSGVAGIAIACADNNFGGAGIAPYASIGPQEFGVKAVLAKVSSGDVSDPYVSVSLYRNVISWVAGHTFTSVDPPFVTTALCPPSIPTEPLQHWIHVNCAAPVSTPARVINVSLYASIVSPIDGAPPVLHDLFEHLASSGVFIVYAAGNHGLDISTDTSVSFAADASAISAGNCTIDRTGGGIKIRLATRTCWEGASNWGAFTVCALGHNAPTIASYCAGTPVEQNSTSFPSEFCPPRATSVCTIGGTSAAAPTVSGAVALMLLANRDLSLADIKDILISTSDKTNLALDSMGITLAPAELTVSRVYGGSGLINVCRSVEEAIKRKVGIGGVPKRGDGTSYCSG